jgi:GNAT superfamily N-acetyltransferase
MGKGVEQTSKVTVRLATPADREALIDLKHIINLAEHAVYPLTTNIPEVLDLSREAAALGVDHYFHEIAEKGGAFLVAEREGFVIGCGCWYGEMAAVSTLPAYRQQANIGGIVVLPSARGLGLGRTILEALEDLIRKAGITRVRLTVVPGNKPAETLYRNFGFEDFETVMIKKLS